MGSRWARGTSPGRSRAGGFGQGADDHGARGTAHVRLARRRDGCAPAGGTADPPAQPDLGDDERLQPGVLGRNPGSTPATRGQPRRPLTHDPNPGIHDTGPASWAEAAGLPAEVPGEVRRPAPGGDLRENAIMQAPQSLLELAVVMLILGRLAPTVIHERSHRLADHTQGGFKLLAWLAS